MGIPIYEEWRLAVVVPPSRISVGEITHELGRGLPRGVDLHRKGRRGMRLYARDRDSIEQAEAVVRNTLASHGLQPELTQTTWNPLEERWQSPLLPVGLPDNPNLPASWAELGDVAWEVRLRVGSRGEAERLAVRLEDRGAAVIRNGLRVTVGVEGEAAARQVAGELRVSAPTASIEVRALSRWRRWLLEQRLVGNYADGGGGGNWGDGGGGGGDGGGG